MRIPAFRTKGKFYLLCLAVGSAGICHALGVQAADKALDDRAVALRKYETLKARVMGDDLTVDWQEFRLAAVQAQVSGGFDWHPVRARVLAEVDNGELAAALAGAETVVGHNMAEPEGHLLAMMVYQKLDRDADAQREQRILDAIVKSIMTSGDGQTAAGAWATVSRNEEEFIVNMVLDAEARNVSVVQNGGRAFDRLTVTGEDGAEHVLWFAGNGERGGGQELRVQSEEPSGLSTMLRR